MTEFIRVVPEQAKQKSASGSALLVCAYDDEQTREFEWDTFCYFVEELEGLERPQKQ